MYYRFIVLLASDIVVLSSLKLCFHVLVSKKGNGC